MTEIANFKPEPSGVEIATIISTANAGLEIMRASDGTYRLTVHNRDARTDRWDDLSVPVTARDFAVLGSIATGAACTCGASNDGRWANKHTAACASLERATDGVK